jgi:hypothetical protein
MCDGNGVAMSQSGRKDAAYPKSKVDDAQMFWFIYCGGMGAGECRNPLGVTQYVYPIRVPKFVVFNRSLLLTNEQGVEIGTDTSVGLCTHNFGTRVPFWLAFSADGVMTDDEVKSKGMMFDQSALDPYDIFIQSKDLPQPTDPDWVNRIYVHIVWDSASYYNRWSDMRPDILKVTKHDMDEKI